MGVYVEAPEGRQIFADQVQAERWLQEHGYAREDRSVEYPAALARVFSDDGVSYWTRPERARMG